MLYSTYLIRAKFRQNKYTAIGGTVIVPRMILSTHVYSRVNVLLNSIEDMITTTTVMIDKYLVIIHAKTLPQLNSWY